MEVFKRVTKFDFVRLRWWSLGISTFLNVATLVAMFAVGLNFGLDFTGGTLVEVSYAEPADVTAVRKTLAESGHADAVVQRFGGARELMIRLPLKEGAASAKLSAEVVATLRNVTGEREVQSEPGQAQKCVTGDGAVPVACHVQVKRVEFVGPQVGEELAWKGGLALLLTAAGILIYVIFRFEWRFAVGAIVASAHDVFLVFGFFVATQMEFSLSVLAAILAVLGYSVNDTVVVFDRIRENFRKMRKSSVVDILNASINETLSRTIITSGSTSLTLIALYFLGGETLRGFSLALLVGVFVGTYSTIFIATPTALFLGITREDMLPAKKVATQGESTP
jgi:preprotein translocase subunit SecF